jgi:phosphatidylglycerophosphate synthase
VLATVRDIYRQSKKKRDNFWTEWISRPPAAVLVWLLRSTSVTPNQVSFLAIAVAGAGAATLILWRTWVGLIASGLILQLAYIIDCVDGQLARLKNQSSPVGALLDFMLDEVKAFLVIGAASVRLWWMSGFDARWLLIGIAGLFAASVGITLTTFMRRPEYLEATGAPPIAPATERGGFLQRSLSPLALVEAAGRYVLHYPSWFLFVCAANRLDIFLYAYLGAHVLYLGRSSLIILIKLGRPARTKVP